VLSARENIARGDLVRNIQASYVQFVNFAFFLFLLKHDDHSSRNDGTYFALVFNKKNWDIFIAFVDSPSFQTSQIVDRRMNEYQLCFLSYMPYLKVDIVIMTDEEPLPLAPGSLHSPFPSYIYCLSSSRDHQTFIYL